MRILDCYYLESINKNWQQCFDGIDQKTRRVAVIVFLFKAYATAIAGESLSKIYRSISIIGRNRIEVSPFSVAYGAAWLVIAHDCVVISQNILECRANFLVTSLEFAPNQENYDMAAEKSACDKLFVKDTIIAKPVLFSCIHLPGVQRFLKFWVDRIV